MDISFLPHNTHLENAGAFETLDPHLKRLNRQPLRYRSPLLRRLPDNQPGIFTLGGGRQVGKTTLVKQWMAELLQNGNTPENILYLTGELIDDQHSLVRLVMDALNEMSNPGFKYLVIDEVSYIREWDKGIKYLADAGMIEDTALLLTGSDLVIIKEARMRFPGRRGISDIVDFHLFPLSFAETVRLKKRFSEDEMEHLTDSEIESDPSLLDRLFEAFDRYLLHGGFLTAINDMEKYDRVMPATLSTYSDWIRGDVLKRGKQEHYLHEILEAVIKRYGSQITWNVLAQDLSIDHPKTVSDYIDLLSSMDAVFVQAALIEDKLVAAPKKARKVMFTDPFVFHAVKSWLRPDRDPYHHQMIPTLDDPGAAAKLVEACAVIHHNRHFPTYYIKAEGEVDIAYVAQGRFWPVEVKWTHQIRPKDLKQLAKYPNGRILGKSRQYGKIQGIPIEPLPLALFRL
ncbi:MAG: ATP-binding protein [Pseudomonadota bacterium]